MIDDNAIKQAFQDFHFESYSKVIQQLLSAYDISDTTIAKINFRLVKGERGPFFVYRRAVIYCGENEYQRNHETKDSSPLPLSIILQPTSILIHNHIKGDVECGYNELYKHLDFLSPLSCSISERKDHYKTLELDMLVESLFRTLVLDNNDKYESRQFILSLLYIAHFRNLLKLNQLVELVSSFALSDERKLKGVFSFFEKENCRYIKQNLSKLSLSKEAYRYIFPIIKFDTTTVDAEVLSSLIYRMVDAEDAGLYGHQTSFVNVEKVLNPLLFDELDSEIEKASAVDIENIVYKIKSIKILDPTNGPGCFLVSAYNGLTYRLRQLKQRFNKEYDTLLNVGNFVGIVENQLTEDLTILALTFSHMAELVDAGKVSFAQVNELLLSLNVIQEDELESEWSNYVTADSSLFIVGSPEFKGAHKLSVEKKSEMQKIYNSDTLFSADYCSTWLVKAAKMIGGTQAKAAFVLTNSISQGNQASFILDKINEAGCEYVFGYRSFKWKTNKSDNVGVTVVIVGIASRNAVQSKYLYDGTAKVLCSEIGANLLPDIDIRIKSRTKVLSPILPEMKKGNMSYCADALIFESEELNIFLTQYPDAAQYIRPLYGSDEFVKSAPRWCLWITDSDLEKAEKIAGIASRIEAVRIARSGSSATNRCKENPHKFRDTNTTSSGNVSLIVPCVTSERRLYFQMGLLDDKAIVNNLACVVYDCDIWLLALLESKMHTVWAKNAAGGHETRPRYSCDLCYNTFPVPDIDKNQKTILRNLAKTLLEVRERYCDKSLAEMYTKMPPELQRVHSWIDATVDAIYRSQPFNTDGERLIWLKNLYNNMLNNE